MGRIGATELNNRLPCIASKSLGYKHALYNVGGTEQRQLFIF